MNETSIWAGERFRVTATLGALYGEPQRCRKRRRCDGHLADPHWIEPGDMLVWSALPPNHPDVGNTGWWHSAFCTDCAPTPTPRPVAAEQTTPGTGDACPHPEPGLCMTSDPKTNVPCWLPEGHDGEHGWDRDE